MKSSKQAITITVLLLILVAGIPLTLSQTQVQQILSGNAWYTAQSAFSACNSAGTVDLQVSFTNKESSRGMIVKAVDDRTGKYVNLGSVAAGRTATDKIITGLKTVSAGQVTFNLAWTDNQYSTDKRYASYGAIAYCNTPTATPTIKPTATPTGRPTATPTIKSTPTPTTTPKPTATPTPTELPTNTPAPSSTTCPTPGTVRNIQIKCPYCTPSPVTNQ